MDFNRQLSESLLHAAARAASNHESIFSDDQLKIASILKTHVNATLPNPNRDIPYLPSGANHDAIVLADFTRAAMLWVRCRAGISHSPLEHVEDSDMVQGALALYYFMEQSDVTKD